MENIDSKILDLIKKLPEIIFGDKDENGMYHHQYNLNICNWKHIEYEGVFSHTLCEGNGESFDETLQDLFDNLQKVDFTTDFGVTIFDKSSDNNGGAYQPLYNVTTPPPLGKNK
jgi:hypothetical protein